MANTYFDFKQFRINQQNSPFKVGTDGVLLGAWSNVPETGRVLDIGTGTGLLALMIAQRCNSEIIAIEPDLQAAMEAVNNVKLSRWSDRVRIINKSLQEFAGSETVSFELIITNPPFFSNSCLNSTQRLSKSRHNITLKPEEILDTASKLLSDSGSLSLILPYTEGNLFIATASGYGLYCNRLTKVKAVPSKPVGRLLMEFSKEKKNLVSDFLAIERGYRHEYTFDYIELTRDFYLEF